MQNIAENEEELALTHLSSKKNKRLLGVLVTLLVRIVGVRLFGTGL